MLAVSLGFFLIASLDRVRFWMLMVLWGLHVFHMAHGQFYRPGYFIGYVEGVLVAAYLVPLRPTKMFFALLAGAVVFLAAFFLSPVAYGMDTLGLFRHDVLFGVVVANLAGFIAHYFVFNEHREKEEMYRKFADVGKYSSMVFHDIKNLVMAPGLSAEVLRKKLKDYPDPLVAKLLVAISTDIGRVRNFIFDMEQVAIAGDDEECEIKLDERVRRIRNLVSSRLAGVEIECASNAVFRVKPRSFTRALINVLINAADATLRKKISQKDFVPKIRIQVEDHCIVVSDNGGGIDPLILERIDAHLPVLEKASQGGLGIMIVRDYLEELDGKAVFSNGKDGAVVRLLLPGKRVS